MARYIPKSKVNILQTKENEFIVESTGKPYQGTYLEYSNGTFFAGNSPQRPKEKLIRLRILKDNFELGPNNTRYRNLKINVHNNLSKINIIPPSKPLPTVDDYKRGYFTRYFCKRVNELVNYFEIDKNTYNLIINKNPKYDFNLYTIGNIKWTLIKQNLMSVEEINKNILDLKSKNYPFIETLFTNLKEHEPPFTEGDEFTIGKSQLNYIGYYHLHPEFGYAMEGAFHVPTKHKRLFRKEEKIDRGETQMIGRSINQTPRVTTPTRVTPTNTSNVTPSLPSSRGGGGY